ncbi:hypothetical protein [Nocardia australiensis]|uniref:hypothetical protein n=1 Tax=Nocardia australiensis TaxID=2887191 RepID=UPI001D14406D|nr:hypothetical protein [Nocardia australiensis]
MGDFAEIRGRRPESQPPRDEVVLRARANLMRTIESDTSTQPPASDTTGSPTTVAALDTRRRRVLRVMAGVGAACVAAAAIAFGVGHDGLGGPEQTQVLASGPQFTLRHTATLVEAAAHPVGAGPIRHLRFTNLTDEGHPTYDTFVRPDGTALVGPADGVLKETSGYLTAAQLAGLPADPYQLRTQMLSLSHQLGLGYPDEAPDRALYRLATKLLPDPGVAPEVKAGIYRVLAGLDLEAIRAHDLGVGADRTGRPGFVLEFTFEEGYADRMVIDSGTGALMSVETVDRKGTLASGQVYLSAETIDRMPQAPA